MWRLAKIRPAGNAVPLPSELEDSQIYPWRDRYTAAFFDSGSSALSVAVRLALKSKSYPAPEVLLPAYGCPDIVAALIKQGVKPVFVDLSADLPRMDLEAVRELLTNRTIAIVAVGLLGIPERLLELRDLADSVGAKLIEDAAQVFPPASCDAGVSDYVVVSFGRGKPLNLMGGGALLIRNDHAASSGPELNAFPTRKLRYNWQWKLKRKVFNTLISRYFYGFLVRVPMLGIGATKFHPVSGIRRQEPLPGLLSVAIAELPSRKNLIQQYVDSLQSLKGSGWKFPILESDAEDELAGRSQRSDFPVLRFPVLAPSPCIRNRVLKELNRLGLGASEFYGCPLPEMDEIKALFPEESSGGFPCAKDFSSKLVTLPTHEDIKDADVELIANTIKKIK